MTLNSLGRLSWLTTGGGDPISFFSQAHQIFKSLLGASHWCTLTAELNVARTHFGVGEIDTALTLMLKIRDAHKKAAEISLPRLGVVEFFLGMLFASKQGAESSTAAIMHFKSAE